MKLTECSEKSIVIIEEIPEGLIDEASQQGLCIGESIILKRKRLGLPLLIEVRGTQYGLRKDQASKILVKQVQK